MSEEQERLEARLDQLERRGRWLIGAVLVALGALTLAGMAGEPASSVVRGTGFELVDGEGKVRAKLELRDGDPFLALLDGAGVERLALQQTAEDTALFIRDESGVIRLGAAQFAHGGGGFALHGPES